MTHKGRPMHHLQMMAVNDPKHMTETADPSKRVDYARVGIDVDPVVIERYENRKARRRRARELRCKSAGARNS